MRKIIAGILGILMALAVVGCQATPDKEVVVGKDDVEQAIVNAPEQENDAVYTAPSEWSDELTQDSTGNKVHVAAEVVCPVASGVKVTEHAHALNFSQQEIDDVIDFFFGDNTLYNGESQQAKGDIGYQILETKRVMTLSQEERDAKYGGVTMEELQSRLEELENRYAAAPEKADRSEVTSELSLADDGSEGLEAQAQSKTGYAAEISAINANQTGNGGNIHISIIDQSSDAALVDGDYETAISQTLAHFGLSDMILTRSGEVIDNDGMAVGTRYYYTQAIGGLPIRSKCHLAEELIDEYAPAVWGGVSALFDVKNGRVIGFFWANYGSVGDTVKENVVLLPFEEIQGKVAEYIFRQPIFNAEGQSDPYRITKAELCMVAIAEKDAPGQSTFTPAWNFYGFPKCPKQHMRPVKVRRILRSACLRFPRLTARF